MTSLAAPHAAVPTSTSPLSRSFASARATLAHTFRTFAIAVELERERPVDRDALLALLRG